MSLSINFFREVASFDFSLVLGGKQYLAFREEVLMQVGVLSTYLQHEVEDGI